MSRYIHDFKLKPDQDKLKVPQEYDIFYSKEPTSLYGMKEVADSDCRILNDMSVHVEQHYCQFEVEKIGEDKFAIVCKAHPDA